MELELEFEWDEKKNAKNIKKHGVSFETAKMAFFDPKQVISYDYEHSWFEGTPTEPACAGEGSPLDRWQLYGMAGWKLVMVCYTERNERIRILSAREADKTDEEEYFYGYSSC